MVLKRVRDIAFPEGTPPLSLVHVLDLAEKGVIKPHIDSERVSLIILLSLLINAGGQIAQILKHCSGMNV